MFLFFLIYNLLIIFAAIVFLPVILIALAIQPKFRAGIFKKLGFYNIKLPKRHTIFFHAVSVGEVNAVETLIKTTRKEFPDSNIVLSTTTKTGQEIANKKLYDIADAITYFPFDSSIAIQSFLNNVKPDVIIIAETEIWPCFVWSAKRRNIPVYIVNGRISPRSYKGYKKFSFFFKPILSLYKGILMQTQGDAQRMIDIGANPEITKVMGNLKFDIEQNINEEQINSLKDEISLGASRLIIAASTHKGEDEIILDVFKKLKSESAFNDIKLIIAPRHPQRYENVEALIKETGYAYGKRSQKETFEENEIVMLDTMGELMKFFSLSYFAYIGGSFSGTGGHNPLEANIWGKPVVSGPSVFNFKDIYAFLSNTKAAALSDTPERLFADMKRLLEDEDYYKEAAMDALKIFAENKGAVDYVINVLKTE